MQLPIWETESQWTPPVLSECPSWKGAKRVALDVETYDPHLKTLGPSVRRGGYIVGISVAIEDGPSFYLPTRHESGDNLDEQNVLAYVRDNAKDFYGTVAWQNGAYDLDYFLEAGIQFPNVQWFRDPMIADPLINELHYKYNLDAIAERHGVEGKDERLLLEAARNYGVDPKNDMWRLPARFVGAYAEQDTRAVLKILRRQERLIDEQNLWEVYDMESELSPILVDMRRRGVRIDQDKLQQIVDYSITEENNALAKIKELTGVTIPLGDIMKMEFTVRALNNIGVKVTKDDSLDKLALKQIGHPVINHIIWAREIMKLRTTFAKSIMDHMVNGRIHGTFHQLRATREGGDEKGARFGRLSMSDPNLQQQPARGKFASMWRSIYIPDRDDQMWLCADFSQQEPRWLTHYAEIVGLPGAQHMAEEYRTNPDADNHSMMTRMVHPDAQPTDANWKKRRDKCKQIFLALCYGMGSGLLAKKLGLPTQMVYSRRLGREIEVAGEEAQALFDLFNKRAPYVKRLADKCQQRAMERGYVETLSGRRLRFPQKADGSYDWLHKALNKVIQGTSGDHMKKTMIALYRAGFWLQLQVHDEVDKSIDNIDQAKQIGEIMESAVPCNVPIRVDLEAGPNWGTLKKVKV